MIGFDGECKNEWPDPTPEMMESIEFNAIWELVKGWNISVPGVVGEGVATGNHVRAIMDAISNAMPETMKSMVAKLKYGDLGGSTRLAIVERLERAISKTML